jgi:lipopolysaccharide biosynthesis glycosyltransferase
MTSFTNMRLVAPSLFFGGYRRAVYLDSDIRVCGSALPLFEIDLAGRMMSAVEDCGFCRDMRVLGKPWHEHISSMGVDASGTYFNAGMLVIDIEAWKALDLEGLTARFREQHRNAAFEDQDFINWVVAGRAIEISPRWNFQTHYFDLGITRAIDPVVFHYLDILKPWRDPEWCYDPGHVRDYLRLFSASPWPDFVPRELLPGWRDFPARMIGRHPVKRAHPDEVYQRHAANVLRDRPARKQRVIERVASAADSGRYADLAREDGRLLAARLRALL